MQYKLSECIYTVNISGSSLMYVALIKLHSNTQSSLSIIEEIKWNFKLRSKGAKKCSNRCLLQLLRSAGDVPILLVFLLHSPKPQNVFTKQLGPA